MSASDPELTSGAQVLLTSLRISPRLLTQTVETCGIAVGVIELEL
jgi:hypothetical protein